MAGTHRAGTHRWIAIGLSLASAALLVPALAGQDAAPTAAPRVATVPHHKSHKAPKPVVLPPMAAGPLSQLPMDQIPAAPAKVSFQGGLLTISAQNSTLGEILRDVRQLTGAAIEIPQGAAANERVIARLGPGAPRDVLAGLLNGSSFDYVMLGSSTDPTAVSSVILTNKSPSSGEAPQTAAAYQSNPEPVASHPWPPGARPMPPNPAFNRAPGAPQPGPAADDSKDDDQDAADDADDPAQPAQPDANVANPNAAQDQAQPTDPNQPNAGPKTPEQILDMLRRQQPPGAPITAPQQPPQQ